MNTIWEYLYLRRMAIDYVSPPVCEVIFSGSSHPVIILSEHPLGKVTGLVLGGFSGFTLSWNVFPGAICYNIYFIGGDNVAVLLAECIHDNHYDLPPNGPGKLVVTPITPTGEGPPSDPIDYPTGGGGGVSTVALFSDPCDVTSRASFPGVFTISREAGDTIGDLTVYFTISGTAANGIDYEFIENFVIIPNGLDYVELDITPKEENLVGDRFVILTLDESLTYFVSPQNIAAVKIRLPQLRIVDYGSITFPLFTPPAGAIDSDFCEWDGTWNVVQTQASVPNNIYYYRDTNDATSFTETAIQGKRMYQVQIAGPFNFPAPNTWQLQILCLDVDNNPVIVWQGLKQGSIEGAYEWNGSGSDTRPNIFVTLFP